MAIGSYIEYAISDAGVLTETATSPESGFIVNQRDNLTKRIRLTGTSYAGDTNDAYIKFYRNQGKLLVTKKMDWDAINSYFYYDLRSTETALYGTMAVSFELTELDEIDVILSSNQLTFEINKSGVVVVGDGVSSYTGIDTDTAETVIDNNNNRASVNVLDSPKLGGTVASAFALKSNVLLKGNTTPFSPFTTYDPATKKYVDDSVNKAIIYKGLWDSTAQTDYSSLNSFRPIQAGWRWAVIGTGATIDGVEYKDGDFITFNQEVTAFTTILTSMIDKTDNTDLVTSVDGKIGDVEIFDKHQLLEQVDSLRYKTTCTSTDLSDGRVIRVRFPDVYTPGDGGALISIDDGVTYIPMCNQNDAAANLFAAPLAGKFYTLVRQVSPDCFKVITHDKAHLALAGIGWAGETIKNNADTNTIQQSEIINLQNAVATGGQIATQAVEVTIPTTLSTTETKLVFDNLKTESLDPTILTVDGANDHILNSTNEAGFNAVANFSIRNLSNGVAASVILRLYADDGTGAVLSDELTFALGKGETVNKSKDNLIVLVDIPQTLTVTAQVLSGTAEIVSGVTTLITSFTTGGVSPSPEQSATLTVAGWSGGLTQTISGLTVVIGDTVLVTPQLTSTDTTSKAMAITSGLDFITEITTDGELDAIATTTPTADIVVKVKKVV